MAKRIDFQTEPARYRHWKLKFDGDVAELIMDVDENGRPVRGLPAQAQLLRPRRRHRARRRRAAAALRAPGGEGGGAEVRQGSRVLRRRQHPHAGRRHPRAQGQLLQVHQRDAQLHGGRQRELRAEVSLRHRAARRPAAATSWRWRPTTSCSPTTATRPCRCPSCRCWRCCPAPAA